jgi:hypothetical protein
LRIIRLRVADPPDGETTRRRHEKRATLGWRGCGRSARHIGLAQEIKISHQWKANADGRDLATRVFVKEVNARDPNLKFRIYPAQSLGIKPVAQLDVAKRHTGDGRVSNVLRGRQGAGILDHHHAGDGTDARARDEAASTRSRRSCRTLRTPTTSTS